MFSLRTKMNKIMESWIDVCLRQDMKTGTEELECKLGLEKEQ